MLLKQMYYFVKIIEYDSFTKAAEECYISQSAISQQIKNLEQELGVQLLKRQGKKVYLSDAGEYFYRHAIAVLDKIEGIKRETIRRGEDHELSLKIGYLKTLDINVLQHTIADYTELYPEVSFSITNGTHEELYRLLKSQEANLLLSDQRRAFDSKYNNYELITNHCYVEVSLQHRLSSLKQIDMAELTGETCIIVSTQEQQDIEKEYYQNVLGFKNQFLFAETLEAARLLVTSNRGFLLTESMNHTHSLLKGVVHIPLMSEGQRMTKKYYAFWSKKNTNYYLEEFVSMLQEQLNNKQE